MSLDRFHQAQDSRWAGYATALQEMHAGHKSSHWIWYIFPQSEGLGHSSTARDYALHDLNETCAYLRDPLLRSRYEEITGVVAEQLASGVNIDLLMGGSTDSYKLVSSLTLFRAAASHLAQSEGGADFTRVVQCGDTILQLTTTQGYPPCTFTLERCAL